MATALSLAQRSVIPSFRHSVGFDRFNDLLSRRFVARPGTAYPLALVTATSETPISRASLTLGVCRTFSNSFTTVKPI
jgi:hypothetical protein